MINDYTEISLNLPEMKYILSVIAKSDEECPEALDKKLAEHAKLQVLHTQAELAIIKKLMEKEKFYPTGLTYNYQKGQYLYYYFTSCELQVRVHIKTFEVEKIVNKFVKEW